MKMDSAPHRPEDDLWLSALLRATEHHVNMKNRHFLQAAQAVSTFASMFDTCKDSCELTVSDPGLASATILHGRFGFLSIRLTG